MYEYTAVAPPDQRQRRRRRATAFLPRPAASALEPSWYEPAPGVPRVRRGMVWRIQPYVLAVFERAAPPQRSLVKFLSPPPERPYSCDHARPHRLARLIYRHWFSLARCCLAQLQVNHGALPSVYLRAMLALAVLRHWSQGRCRRRGTRHSGWERRAGRRRETSHFGGVARLRSDLRSDQSPGHEAVAKTRAVGKGGEAGQSHTPTRVRPPSPSSPTIQVLGCCWVQQGA